MPAAYTHVQVNCPYCVAAWKGANPHVWIMTHVANLHPEKLKEFQCLQKSAYVTRVLTSAGIAKEKREEKLRKQKEEKMSMEDENIMQAGANVEQPIPQTPVTSGTTTYVPSADINTPHPPVPQVTKVILQQQVQQPPKPQKMEMPFEQIPSEADWLSEFLMKYDLSTKFVTFQMEKLAVKGTLPHPRELLSDLNELDSGSKIKKQNDLIAWFYDHALALYMKKKESLNMPFDTLPYGYQPNTMTQPTGYGERSQFDRPTRTMEPPQMMPTNYNEYSEVRELKAQLESMRQEKYNEMANKLRDMESKLEQTKLAPHQDSTQQRLEQKLDMMEAENKRLQQQYADQSQQVLLGKFSELERRATAAPTPEMIQGIVQNMLEQDRVMKIRPEELDQKIREMILKEKTGITPEAVQMSQIEKKYELDKMKLENDKNAPGMWMDGLKDIAQSAAGVIGDRMGQAMAVKPSMPQQPSNVNTIPTGPYEQGQQAPPMANMRPCPACGKAVMVSAPGEIGQCPHCRTPIQVTMTGELAPFDIGAIREQQPSLPQVSMQPQPQPPQQPTLPEEPTNGDALGKCAGCGRTVYYFNIAETDSEGKHWCKKCRGA